MKIKILTGIAGLDYSYTTGQVVECEEKRAIGFLNAKVAEVVQEEADETASKPKKKK